MVKLNLDQWQKDFLKCKGDKMLCKGRQIGGSVVAAIDCAEYVVANPKTEPVVMIAPTERQATGLFNKTLAYLLDNYPKLVVMKGVNRPTKKRIKLKTGVEIYCLPVGKTGLGVRFLTVGRLYKDECSQIPELVHEAIDPCLLTTGGDEILLSTPFGAVGTFYDAWINKDGAWDSFTRFDINNPITSEKVMRERPICATWTQKQKDKALMKMEQAKKRWSTKRYAQEYLGEFVEDLHRWFSEELINDTCVLQRLDHINSNRKFAMGCDIARMGEDEGTFEIIDHTNLNALVQVENIVTTKQLTTQTEDRIIELHRKYHFTQIYIDAGSGSLGVSIFDHLLRNNETKRHIVAINNRARSMEYDSDKSMKLLKEDLYDNLRSLMEQGKIKLLDDPELIASLRSIQYEYVMKDDQPTRLKIFGDYSHIVEGLIRASWCVKDKSLKPFVDFV